MFWKKTRTTLISFCLAFLLGLFLSGLPMRVMAQQSILQIQGQSVRSQPPGWLALRQGNERRPLPGRREPAAGRGCGESMPQPPLTALSPQTNLGFTVATYPKFFFYIPQMPAKALKFSLIKEDKNKVYEKKISLPNTAGIFNFNISSNKKLPPIEVGKDYHWYFQIICSEQDGGDTYVDGWVQRAEPNSTGNRQLERVAPSEKFSRDRKNEFWYDAIATLAEKRRTNPNDGALAAEWENLLRSEGLDKIARKPLVGSLANGES